jgi:ribosomal-protein-alanine N-acetyltransferase
MKILETERTIIRQLQDSDLEAFYLICGNPEIMQYIGDGKALTKEKTKSWIEKSKQNYQNFGYGCWAVTNKNNEFVGYCGLVYPPNSKNIEIIYALGKEHWGKGLASEIVSGVIKYAFEQLKLEEIFATVDPNNLASIKILEKGGFSFWKEELDENALPTLYYVIENQ